MTMLNPTKKARTVGRPRTTPLPDPNRRRKITIVGVAWTGSEPFIATCLGMMEGPRCQAATEAARVRLMHSIAGQHQMPIEDIEIHEVMILAGHAHIEGAEPPDNAAVPALEEAA